MSDPQETLVMQSEIVKTPVDALDILDTARALTADLSDKGRAVQEFVDKKQAALNDAGARWQPLIETQVNEMALVKSEIFDFWNLTAQRVIEAFKAGELEGERLIYFNGLLAQDNNQTCVFDFEAADQELSRFQRLQAGTRIVMVDMGGDIGGDDDIRVEGFYNAGVLSEPPKVTLKDDTNPRFINPQVTFTFEHGEVVTENWIRGMAIGDDEVRKVALALIADSKDALDSAQSVDAWNIRSESATLAKLVRLDLDLPEIDELKERIFAEFVEGLDQGMDKKDVIECMQSLYVTDEAATMALFKRLAADPRYQKIGKLIDTLIEIMFPLLDDLPTSERQIAQAKAASYLIGLFSNTNNAQEQ